MRIVLLGEQATGKSSLLVALYGALLHRRAGALRIERSLDDLEFLSGGLAAHARFQPVPRTEVDSDSRVVLELSRNGRRMTIELPDRSGELMRTTIDRRLWDPHLLALARTADAAMLFLRADWLAPADEAEPAQSQAGDAASGEPAAWAADEPGTWSAPDTEPLAAYDDPFLVPPAMERGEPLRSAQPNPEPEDWAPSDMPLDVRAVDLLQETLEKRSKTLPVAVIVSAWDGAGNHADAPAIWLAERAPLLAQFLEANADRLPHEVFGVSAQGGDFSANGKPHADPEDPWDRAFLLHGGGTPGTLASPVEWLLDGV